MSRFEVTKTHLGLPARVKIERNDMPRLQLLWLRIASHHGGRRMGEIGELMAEAVETTPGVGWAIAWTVYESLRPRGLAESNFFANQQLRFFPTELGRAYIAEADREVA